MKIYTKTGDLGKTSLGSGKRVDKFHPRIECYGTIDELNSVLGLAAAQVQSKDENELIFKIQNQLFNLGSLVACDSPKKQTLLPQIKDEHVTFLEQKIDEFTAQLPALKNFILPGGSIPSSTIHIARCVARRAERLAFQLNKKQKQPKTLLVYLNRLSDFLFVFARYVNHKQLIKDVAWNKNS
jgi:cob(I)alamin adenosyltransferase